jgi:hypothetical protein
MKKPESKRLRAACAALILVSASASASTESAREREVRTRLKDFDADPSAFMRKAPGKSSASATAPSLPPVAGQASMRELTNALIDRLERDRPPALALPAFGASQGTWLRAPVSRGDRAEDLVDRLAHRTLGEMQSASLLSAQLTDQPWSDSYWPISKGVLAWRYADPKFPKGHDWKANTDYVAGSRATCSVDQLSPAEKYDLLVGDADETLTRAMIGEGEGYYASSGSVESWMGICHGWAPASFMEPRPGRSVEAVAADGRTRIRFLPSDIKALVSLLWANGRFENRFIGSRCRDKTPETDENGRILDPACYGENPGTWHLSVVNQIGANRRSFIMNANHDTEVWNQPIYGYEYSYFNPETREPAPTIKEATVTKERFKSDSFKKYRSPRARAFAGIAMDVTYVAETSPSVALEDSPAEDSLITIHYMYDLELDGQDRIIGGEWYTNDHPGFLWTAAPGARARSIGDALLSQSDPSGSWDGASAVPSRWREAIQRSARHSQPVARIVDTLNLLARLELGEADRD